MESTTVKNPVLIYTEQTPNPESLKFVTNRMLYQGTADFKNQAMAEQWSPVANELFAKPYVSGVYISNNYITVSKELNYAWRDIMVELKDFIKEYVEREGEIVKEGFAEAMAEIQAEEAAKMYSGQDAEMVKKIKELLDTYVKPAVEMDGGNIEFKKYEDGIV